MKVLIAPCEFKETLSPQKAAEVMKEATRDAGLSSILHPVGDGGGGTLDALRYNLKGTLKWYWAHDPLFRKIKVPVFYHKDFAFIEMANTSGLKLLKEHEKDPLNLTSVGTGEMIKKCIEEGCKKIYIGVGGSATVDGGVGTLYALGVRLFYDKNGNELEPIGRSLMYLHSIYIPKDTLNTMKDINITILSDVKNPLLGKNGAVVVYGPQKRLKKEYFDSMEKGLEKLSEIILNITKRDIRSIPGGGAAGGIPSALYGLFGAKIEDGVDVVLTGEGSFDEQSLFGKAPYKVAELAKKYKKEVIVLCGSASISKRVYNAVDAVFSITNGIQTKKRHLKKLVRIYTLQHITLQNF